MSEELKRVGDLFKTKRHEMNLSLKEVENSTSIRSSYLEAIEEGHIHDYISGVYALGFIKQYGQFLGIDMETMIQNNPIPFRMPSEKHEFNYGIGTLEMRSSSSGGVKWLPNLLWAGAVSLILVAAWYLAKTLGLF